MLWWDGIPGLRGAIVQEVDAVQVHVLRMPGEGGLPHAEVEVGCRDALDLDVVCLVDRVKDCAQLAHVPHRLVRVGQAARDVGAIDGLVEGDVLPVLTLQLLPVAMAWCPVS